MAQTTEEKTTAQHVIILEIVQHLVLTAVILRARPQTFRAHSRASIQEAQDHVTAAIELIGRLLPPFDPPYTTPLLDFNQPKE